MTEADIIVFGEGERVDWGRWVFASVPSAGHKLAVAAADGTLVYLRVRDVEHHPVRAGPTQPTTVVICDWQGEDVLDSEVEMLLSRG